MNEPRYALKRNDRAHELRAHVEGCLEIEKRGGGPGQYNQVHWWRYRTPEQLVAQARVEHEATGWQIEMCRKQYCAGRFPAGLPM